MLAAYVEAHTTRSPVADAMARELVTLAGWIGLNVVKVTRRERVGTGLAALVGARE